MFEGHDHIVYHLLAGQGLADLAALEAALAEHTASGRPLADLVIQRGLIDKPALLRAVAASAGGEYAERLPAFLGEDVRSLIDRETACRFGVVPVGIDGRSVAVVAEDPFTPNLLGDLSFALGREVRLMVADPEQVGTLTQQYHGRGAPVGEMAPANAGASASDPPALGNVSEADIEQMAGQAPIVRFVNGVLAQAIRDKASDVHFEPFEHDFKLRYRIDGALHELAPPPKALALPIASRLKVLAGLNIAERRLPQDGRIRLNLAGRAVDLRVSTLPTQFGESVVLRVLDQSSLQIELGQVGLGSLQPQVEEVIRRPSGILIVTGPTGSGKTTTLYGCLKVLNSIGAKLLTVEDPVEYEIDGVVQVPVNPAAGLTFARALRTFLRQDPDIVMVGEIRDLETAQIAIQASLTGHLVLSTLHTNDAVSSVTRLTDMGIEPFLLASTLEAVLAQRLVRRICPDCRVAREAPDALSRLGPVEAAALQGRMLWHGAGCPACHHTGYKGRMGLFEFMRMTDPLREFVVAGASLAKLRQCAAGEGMTSLRAAGLRAIIDGETSIDEVAKYT